MKFNRSLITATSILFLGSSLTAYGQQGHATREDGKTDKRDVQAQKKPKHLPSPRPKAARERTQRGQRAQPQPEPASRQKQQPQRAQRNREPVRQGERSYRGPTPQQAQRSHQDAMAWQQQRGWLRQGGWQGHEDWQRSRAHRWDDEHRSWAQRGGYGGSYIQSDRWMISFGSQHRFRMGSRPVMFMGYPRFDCGGYSFMMLDPWPEYWAENWYDSDDLYIDYDDGYYLYDRRYPRVRLAISIVL